MQRNQPAKTASRPGVSATAARLLVVDDEPQIRGFVARAPTAAGYAIDFAGSGKDGLSQATAGDYDLVILDLVMPDMDGREILARLRRERPDQAVLGLSCRAPAPPQED